jgi:hypothetical protein
MPGKYDHITPNLPKLAEEDVGYQDKVNAVRESILADGPKTSISLTAMYVVIREEKEALEDQLSELQLRLKAYEQLIIDQFEQDGAYSIKLDTGVSVSVQVEPYAQVRDRDAFRLWCIANGLERSLALPWQTTNSLTKERLLAGDPEPDGVQAVVRNKIVLRRK